MWVPDQMAEDRLERKVAVILATDVVGYSKHVEDNESLTIRTYRSREATLLELIGNYRGRVFNTGGDSVLAEFASAVDAVECAVAFQTHILETNRQPDAGLKLAFRIGVNMGDVVQQQDNLLGDGVNIAARLEALAQPNGVSISKPVYDLVRAKTDLVFHDLGMQQVKENSFHAYDVLIEPSQKRSLKRPLAARPPVIAAAVVLLAMQGLGAFLWSGQERQTPPDELFLDSRAIKILVGDIQPLTTDQATTDLASGLTQAIRGKLNDYNEVSLPPKDVRDRLTACGYFCLSREGRKTR